MILLFVKDIHTFMYFLFDKNVFPSYCNILTFTCLCEN